MLRLTTSAGLLVALAATFLFNYAPILALEQGRTSAIDITFHKRSVNTTEISACQAIKNGLQAGSGSKVLYPVDLDFYNYIKHYMTSSQQTPTCVVLPNSPDDLATAVKVVGSKRIRFAVSAGTHASNQGFSSTPGVHITLKGFQQVTLSGDKSQVDVGPGNVWDNVYKALDGTGVVVVGGRVGGVGVGGFITGGGGYSWLTSQRGLTVDTLISADLVLPDGTLTTATASQNSDLFWAIKGGGNKFGVIYNFRLRTVPQGQVYGGLRTYTADQVDNMVNATFEFSENNKDSKAQVIPTFNSLLGQPGVILLGFYDGPTPPSDVFAAYGKDQARPFTDDWKTRSMVDLVTSAPSDAAGGQRGAFHTVSLQRYSREILNLIVSELKYYGALSALHSATLISYDVEPFRPYSQYASDSAWPHNTNALPLNIYFAWTDPGQDAFWQAAIKKTAQLITAQARSEGQNLDSLYLYPNYAIAGTPLQSIYGPNLGRLAQLKKKYDPQNVMGLTTYFGF